MTNMIFKKERIQMGKNKEKLDALIRSQQDILDGAKTAGRALSEEEQSRMEELQREIEALAAAGSRSGALPCCGNQRNVPRLWLGGGRFYP